MTAETRQEPPVVVMGLLDRTSIADAVAFLLDAAHRKITGQTLFVDGGVSGVGVDMIDADR